ncbi:phospho-sugar mutase [Tessaracoccus rhinocerotis]|uniref:Phospho-sugar mutase n=1 Tax=Tessaracoccus rhinocerotis TaxID=1689449 RepID=A0A553K541_9ACTN|nr:phospho-sugar mutase [Tessaracoccus rhinocerotis]TRY19801.1 phospho-sugar mutase [Tessaracoccus rhinocerotis]
MIDAVLAHARDWLAEDPDPDTVAELQGLLSAAEGGDQDALAELRTAFAGPLEFGTAGLRGRIGPGPAQMNRVVVGQAAAGFAAWLTQQGLAGGKVLIGFDARRKSDEFARETAEIFAGAGFEPLVTEGPTPTPVVAFGIQHLGCVAGIVVTASHNPPEDNGYKVYLGDGSQIVPPVDGEISECIRKVTPQLLGVLERDASFRRVGDELLAAYVERAASLVPADAPRELTWVHTAMHGVGAAPMRAVAHGAGFPAPLEVAEQAEPDAAFPTVAFPNPEEKGAIDLALALAERQGADVVVANDPDADRCAVAAVVDGRWRMLTGDELGGLLGDYAIRREVPGQFANSVVSSTLLRDLAAAAGREHRTTLTGFKWIGRVPDLAFGYEEAIGYCCDSAAVPDKDGLTAALTVLRLVAELKAGGRTLADRLDEIVATHGLHATSQLSVRVDELSVITDAMARLRAEPPSLLLGEPVAVTDLSAGTQELPPTDAVELTGRRLHVVARPSGTEPKLKCYLEVVLTPQESADVAAARARAEAELERLRAEMAAALGI